MVITIPAEGWAAINTLGLLGIGLITALTHRQARIGKTNSAANGRAIEGVRETLNGPLAAALERCVELTKRISDESGRPLDHAAYLEAVAEAKQNEARNATARAHFAKPIEPESP